MFKLHSKHQDLWGYNWWYTVGKKGGIVIQFNNKSLCLKFGFEYDPHLDKENYDKDDSGYFNFQFGPFEFTYFTKVHW